MDRELMREAEALYALPSEEFTAGRNTRAKELRADDRELAERVAKLPKPTAAAAAINRIARDDPSEMRALVQAGRALRAAQEAAVAGGRAAALADATREHRAALDRVRREARRLGLSETVLDRVAATLRAASVDPELQRLLERGVLAREQQAAGFGLDPDLVAAAPAKPTRKPAAPSRAGRASDRDEQHAQRAAARERVEVARARLTEVRRTAADAERARKRLARDLAAAERAAATAAADVEQAEQALEDARAAVRRQKE